MADTNPDPEKNAGKFSPFAGCWMFIIAGVLSLCMIIFAFWVGTRVESTVTGFTEEQPKPINQTNTRGREFAQAILRSKLMEFRRHIRAGSKGTLTLTSREMNLAIATFDILKPQRGNLRITALTENGITAEISNPVNSKMSDILSGNQNHRYLNAQITILPELVEGAVFPHITSIRPDNGTSVPTKFIQQISRTLMMPFYENKNIAPIYKSLSAVEIRDNTLILHTDPNYIQTDTPSTKKQPVFNRLMKSFTIAALIFLAAVTAILLSRRKAKQF